MEISLLTLAGVQALLTMLVNAGKAIGLVKDGEAEKVNGALQTIVVGALYLYSQFSPIDVDWLNKMSQAVADLGVALFVIYPIFLRLSALFHDKVLAGKLPIVGFSYSQKESL